MSAPKILAAASAIDLDFRYGCTPAWWQLWKGMYEAGVDLVVTPYRGRPVESPWWRTAPNPTYREGESYQAVRDVLARVKGDRYLRRDESNPDESALDKLTRETISRWVTPRWKRHLERLVETEKPDAVIVFTIPMAHLRGIPDALRERFGIPIVFYDGDVPMSLPEYGGMDTGFNPYHGADPVGVRPRALELGGRDRAAARARCASGRGALLGRRSRVLRAAAVEKEVDVFFYGYGDKFRRDWMKTMVGEASRLAPELDFALGGLDFQGDTGPAPDARRHSVQPLRTRDLGGARQPQHDAASARDGRRLVDSASVRARRRPAPRSSPTRTRGSSAGSSRAASSSSSRAPRKRSPRTASSSPIPGRPTRWVDERASACSTSTRTPTARDGCSSSSGSRQESPREQGGSSRSSPPGTRPARSAASSTRSSRSTRPHDVVVVDDASSDDTAAVARAHGATVLRLPFNVGIGGAVQTGFRYARDEGYEIAVRLDGDGQHDASELGKLLGPIRAGRRRPRHRLALRRSRRELPPTVRAADGDPRLRAPRLPPRRAEGDGHDVRLRCAEPRRDRALRRPSTRTTTRRSRRRSSRCAAGCGSRRCRSRCASGRPATSSITFVRSLYYIVKVMLALLVASLRRYPRLEAARR